jgi:predicted HTH transcriptional regulator
MVLSTWVSSLAETKRLEEILSPQMKIAIKIYNLTIEQGKVTYLQDLIEKLKPDISSVTVHKYIDNLMDSGIIEANWVKKDGKWIRAFNIANESKKTIGELKRLVQSE